MKLRINPAVVTGLRDILILALLIFATRSMVADWNFVPSGSMKPSILIGDVVFVNRLAYDLKVPFTTWHLAQWGNPKRGDIVILDSPRDGERLVKRVIGIPGDVIAMRNNTLYINDQPLHYAMDSALGKALMPDDQTRHQFELESLPGHVHPVMFADKGDDAYRNFGPLRLPPDRYLVLGDNRDNSADSRYFGLVARNLILGHAIRVLVSWNPHNYYLPRANRWWHALP